MTLEPATLFKKGRHPYEEHFVVRDVPLTGGVNNRYSPRFIRNDQAAELLNVDLSNPSRPKKRDGYSAIGAGSVGMRVGSGRVSGLAYFDAGVNSRLLVAAVPGPGLGGIYTIANPDSASGWSEALRKFGPSATYAGAAVNVDTDNCRMFQANDLLYILPDRSLNVHVMKIDGALIDTGDMNESPPRGAADGAFLGNRVWLLKDKTLYYSDLLPDADDYTPDPAAWDRDAQSLNLSPERSASAVALRPWRAQSLICFFTNHIEEVVVNPSLPLASVRNLLEPQYGCGSRDSVVVVGDEMYFLDQFGEYRALKQTAEGTLIGMIANPVSDAIRGEIPGNLNKSALDKVRAVLLEERLYLWYPRGAATQANACVVFDTSEPRWYGPWVFADPISALAISDIRGGAWEMFAANGDDSSPGAAVYRMLDGSYADAGTAITYRESGRVWDAGLPEADKDLRWAEMLFKGTVGATAKMYLRGSDEDSWTFAGSGTVDANSDADFPLYDADDAVLPRGASAAATQSQFPLYDAGSGGSSDTSLPLTDAAPQRQRTKLHLQYRTESDLPIYANRLPLRSPHLPIMGQGGGVTRGEGVQVRIESTGAGEEFERHGYRVAGFIDNVELE